MTNKNLNSTHNHHDHQCCDHDHKHEHNCCGHDHNHHQSHSDHHDHDYCGHHHSHQSDLSEFDELYYEQGCGCSHDHSPKKYRPLVSSQKVETSQNQLHNDQTSLINTDISNFLSEFEKLHNKLFSTYSFYNTLGIIYGSVVTDFDDLEEALKKFLNISNSRINKEYLEMSLKVFTYLQANYLYDLFFLNDFTAHFDKTDTSIEKLKSIYNFLDGFVFTANLGISNSVFDADTKHEVFELLRDLNNFQLTANELAQDLALKYNQCTDKVKQEQILNLDFDYISDNNFSPDQKIVLLVARDAILSSKGEHEDPEDLLERVDLAPALALAVSYED